MSKAKNEDVHFCTKQLTVLAIFHFYGLTFRAEHSIPQKACYVTCLSLQNAMF